MDPSHSETVLYKTRRIKFVYYSREVLNIFNMFDPTRSQKLETLIINYVVRIC